MNMNHRRSDGANCNCPSFFNVCAAYEDFSTGNRALGAFGLLFPGCSRSLSLSTRKEWKFDQLELAKLRDIAADEAAEADMVIISAHGPGALPAAVKQWMEIWTNHRKDGPGALVVLLEGAGKRVSQADREEAYLRGCARRAGMDFFIKRESGRPRLHQPDYGAETNGKLAGATMLEKVITGVAWRADKGWRVRGN